MKWLFWLHKFYLKGIDYDNQKIFYMLIEIYNKDKEDIFNFLNSKGYELVKNVTNYNKVDNPKWDGTHNDYLFKYVG